MYSFKCILWLVCDLFEGKQLPNLEFSAYFPLQVCKFHRELWWMGLVGSIRGSLSKQPQTSFKPNFCDLLIFCDFYSMRFLDSLLCGGRVILDSVTVPGAPELPMRTAPRGYPGPTQRFCSRRFPPCQKSFFLGVELFRWVPPPLALTSEREGEGVPGPTSPQEEAGGRPPVPPGLKKKRHKVPKEISSGFKKCPQFRFQADFFPPN